MRLTSELNVWMREKGVLIELLLLEHYSIRRFLNVVYLL